MLFSLQNTLLTYTWDTKDVTTRGLIITLSTTMIVDLKPALNMLRLEVKCIGKLWIYGYLQGKLLTRVEVKTLFISRLLDEPTFLF